MTHNSYYPMSFPPKENFLDETLLLVMYTASSSTIMLSTNFYSPLRKAWEQG